MPTLLAQRVTSPVLRPLSRGDFEAISYPLASECRSRCSLHSFTLLFSGFMTVESWIEEYGPLITLRTGIEKHVVIGRYKVYPTVGTGF